MGRKARPGALTLAQPVSLITGASALDRARGMTEVRMLRKEQSFYGATREEAEAKAAPFVASTNGKIFFDAPVLAPPIGKPIAKWQVDVEYLVEEESRAT